MFLPNLIITHYFSLFLRNLAQSWHKNVQPTDFLGTKLVARESWAAVYTAIPILQVAAIKKKYYIDPDDFERDLATYAETKCQDLLNDICAKYFYPLATKVTATYGHGYADPDDLIQEGVGHCVRQIHRFCRADGRAFTFFSGIILNKGKDIRRSIGRRKSREVPIDDYEERFLPC